MFVQTAVVMRGVYTLPYEIVTSIRYNIIDYNIDNRIP